MHKGERGLNGEALDCLLRSLDEDREAAGENYVLLRRKLVRFFEWRGAVSPDDCADRTLNVAARRIADGEEVRSLPSYCGGVARMVLLEERRTAERERIALHALPSPHPADSATDDEARQRAFEACLEALPADSRELILAYYQGDGRARIAAREQMATRLGIPMNALRIRAHRIRARLEEALRAATGEADHLAKHNGARRHEKVRVP